MRRFPLPEYMLKRLGICGDPTDCAATHMKICECLRTPAYLGEQPELSSVVSYFSVWHHSSMRELGKEEAFCRRLQSLNPRGGLVAWWAARPRLPRMAKRLRRAAF